MTSLVGARIVVTGGAGFIGSHLVDELVLRRRAATVVVVDSLVTGDRGNLARWTGDPRVRLVEADIRSEPGLRALDDADVVFHLAAVGPARSAADPVESHDVNARATLLLLERARAAGVRRFVHVSSGDVLGPARRAPVDERHPVSPDTPYEAAKVAGEAHAHAAFQAHGLPVVIVRPFGTYGPRTGHHADGAVLLPRAILRNLCGLPALVPGDGLQTRDLTHVTDTARALATIAACDGAVGRTVHLGSGQERTVGLVLATVARLIGRPDLEPVRVPPRPGDARGEAVDGRLLHRLTGFTPAMPFEAGVADLVRWFRGLRSTPQQLLARVERDPDGAPGAVVPV